jgi:hypothetical protein
VDDSAEEAMAAAAHITTVDTTLNGCISEGDALTSTSTPLLVGLKLAVSDNRKQAYRMHRGHLNIVGAELLRSLWSFWTATTETLVEIHSSV